jgi:hypothetical protein
MTPQDRLCALCHGLGIDAQMIVIRQRRETVWGVPPTGNLNQKNLSAGIVLAVVELVIEAVEGRKAKAP